MLHGLMGDGGEGFGLGGVPYDDGGAVTEVCVEVRASQIGRFGRCGTVCDFVDKLLHVTEIRHA